MENKLKEEKELTHSAFGTFKGTDGMWYVAKISFNPTTGDTGKFEKIGSGDDRETVNERFKIEVGNARLLG